MGKNLLFILLLFLMPLKHNFGQIQESMFPFYDGESIRMDVYYHLGPLWLRAARVEILTRSSARNGEKVWELLAIGHTLSSYDWFFSVRDTFWAVVKQAGFLPLSAYRKSKEGGHEAFGKYHFDYNHGKLHIVSYTRKRPLKKESLPLQGPVYDLLSGAFYARTFNYSLKPPGTKIPINVVVDDQVYNLFFDYEGVETLVLKNGERVKALRFSAPTVEGTVFKGGDKIRVWVTADGRNYPLKAEADILIGSVQAFTVFP